MLAADTLASYGSLERFKSVPRLHAAGAHTILGASGDMSDFQYLQNTLDQLVIDEFTEGAVHELGPAEVHGYLARVMYSRRSRMSLLWNSLLVAPFEEVSYLRLRKELAHESSKLPRPC